MRSLFLLIFVEAYSVLSSDFILDSNNKFQNLLVYINDDVSEDNGSLLSSVKTQLSLASRSLWKATGSLQAGKAAVQFGTVFIRIPSTWTAKADPITWQQCNKAQFYVTIHRDNNNRTEPFTKQLGKCGQKAEFTKFSEEFFKTKNDKELIINGKKIMNEFVKLRYGVFSEKPYSNMLTAFNGMTFINSTCGPNIGWTLNQPPPMCSDRNKICSYTINPGQHHNYSVMFDTETPESEYFCNDHERPHNKWAQSLHNVKCNRQSVSTVILRHEDFNKNQLSQPLQEVDYQIIKGQSRNIVLVLDVSGSMSSIIDNMRKACVEFLSNKIEDSAFVGIVIFSTRGTIRSYLVQMRSSRQSLINIINGLVEGGNTNIPDGIAKGIEVLGGRIDSSDKVFGTIILLSDGGNNMESPYRYNYAIQQVVQKGIVVNTICYGNAADARLNSLAERSGGKYLFASPQLTYSDLMSKFEATKSCDQTLHQMKMIEGVTSVEYGRSLVESNLTFIDQYIGKDLQITMTFDRDISRCSFTILNPSGKRFGHSKSITQFAGTTLTFDILGIPEFGMYKLNARCNTLARYKRQTNTMTITFRVSATPVAKNVRIINPTGKLSSSEIDILRDDSSIQTTIDLTTCSITNTESVSVTLIMTTPSNRVVDMPMVDDGLGEDGIENDKIFTKNLIAKDLTEIGFYNFLAHVTVQDTITKGVIKRTVELGSLRVKKMPAVPIQDKVPPAKIEDLNVVIVSSEKKRVNIEFLATGNDGMIGNISDYEIKISSPSGDEDFTWSATASPKTKLTFEMNLSTKNVTNPFEVIIRGVDDKGNKGEWSLTKTSNWHYAKIARQSAIDDAALRRAKGNVSHPTVAMVTIWLSILVAMIPLE